MSVVSLLDGERAVKYLRDFQIQDLPPPLAVVQLWPFGSLSMTAGFNGSGADQVVRIPKRSYQRGRYTRASSIGSCRSGSRGWIVCRRIIRC